MTTKYINLYYFVYLHCYLNVICILRVRAKYDLMQEYRCFLNLRFCATSLSDLTINS